jgi:hypothetical protein
MYAAIDEPRRATRDSSCAYLQRVCVLLLALGVVGWSTQPAARALTLASADEVRLALSEHSRPELFRPPDGSLAELRRVARERLLPDDRALFQRATGHTVDELLADSAWSLADFSPARVMGNEKLLPHPLNARGLHALRALLAERIADHQRRKRGSTHHPLFARFARDGILVVPLGELRTLEGLLHSNHSYVDSILHMASGYEDINTGGFTPLREHAHTHPDEQFYMHVDTFIPSWKVFVFSRTALRQGPFHYVVGSHRNTEGRLRWLYERSRRLLNASSVRRIGKLRKGATGPFADETHGFDGARHHYPGAAPEAHHSTPPPHHSAHIRLVPLRRLRSGDGARPERRLAAQLRLRRADAHHDGRRPHARRRRHERPPLPRLCRGGRDAHRRAARWARRRLRRLHPAQEPALLRGAAG